MPVLTQSPIDTLTQSGSSREDAHPGGAGESLDQFRCAALERVGTTRVQRMVGRIREALSGHISPLALRATHMRVSREIQGGILDDPALISLAVDAAEQLEFLRTQLKTTSVAPQQRLYTDLLLMAKVVRQEVERSVEAAIATSEETFTAVSSEMMAAPAIPLKEGVGTVTVTPMGEPVPVSAVDADGNGSVQTKRSPRVPSAPEDVEEIWVAFKSDQSNQELRNRLVEIYLPLVKYNGERIWARLPEGVELDDLISAGVFGLMDAIHAFDLSRGVKFETYCVPRIRGAMLDELRTMDWVPRLVRSKASKLKEATSQLDTKLGRPPTPEELAKYLDISVKELEKMAAEANAVNLISLNKKWYETDSYKDVREIDILEDEKAPRPAQALEATAFIQEILRGCSRTERLILILYYWEELTMKEIGATLGLSESRVSQKHSALMGQRLPQLILAHLGRGDYLDSLAQRVFAEDFMMRLQEQGLIPRDKGEKGNGKPAAAKEAAKPMDESGVPVPADSASGRLPKCEAVKPRRVLRRSVQLHRYASKEGSMLAGFLEQLLRKSTARRAGIR